MLTTAPDSDQSTVDDGPRHRELGQRNLQRLAILREGPFGTTTDRPSMLSEVIDSVVVVAHGRCAPKQSEWRAMYDLIEGTSSVRGSIVTGHPKCPGPNALQRRQGRKAWGRRKEAKLAVITDSALQRGIVTGFSWFLGGRMLAFSPAQWREAMSHLGISVETQRRILDWWHVAIQVLGEPQEYEAVGIDPRKWRGRLPPSDTAGHHAGLQALPDSGGGANLLALGSSAQDAQLELESSRGHAGRSRARGSELVTLAQQPPRDMAASMLGRDDLLLIVHSSGAPTQDEWNEHVSYVGSLFERRPYRGIYCLVHSLGGGPDARQRQEIVDITPAGTRGKLAVLIQSRSTRGAVETHSWIPGARSQIFGPGEYERALSWLGIKSISVATVRNEIDRLLETVTRFAEGP